MPIETEEERQDNIEEITRIVIHEDNLEVEISNVDKKTYNCLHIITIFLMKKDIPITNKYELWDTFFDDRYIFMRHKKSIHSNIQEMKNQTNYILYTVSILIFNKILCKNKIILMTAINRFWRFWHLSKNMSGILHFINYAWIMFPKPLLEQESHSTLPINRS